MTYSRSNEYQANMFQRPFEVNQMRPCRDSGDGVSREWCEILGEMEREGEGEADGRSRRHVPYDTAAVQRWFYPENYPIREYQQTIVTKALFSNTLVVLPTGMGKTLIAAVVMYNFYCWFPTGKIVFMAPTKPLVNQQIKACHNIMGIPEKHTAELMGGVSPQKRKALWKSHRVFYCTPQTMDNDLEKKICDPTKFVCVVIDEAHRASASGYAYTKVAEKVTRATRHVRVLALSATPGKNVQQVQQVIYNLRIRSIEVRGEDDPDLKKYSFQRIFEVIKCKSGEQIQKFEKMLEDLIQPIVTHYHGAHLLKCREASKASKYLLHQALSSAAINELPQGLMFQAKGDLGFLISIANARNSLVNLGIGAFKQNLDDIDQSGKRSKARDEVLKNPDWANLRALISAISEDDDGKRISSSHPKMIKLKEILHEHFQRSENVGQSTRAIVFSGTRNSVEEIVKELKTTPLLRPKTFVGQSSGAKKTDADGNEQLQNKGQNQKQQKQTIVDFHSGRYNVLVATSIGEEGLDIGEVDLIVSFDAVGSPIRMVQRFGRTGRKRTGRVCVLVTEGAEEQKLRSASAGSRQINRALRGHRFDAYPEDERMVPGEPQMVAQVMRVDKYHFSQVAGVTARRKKVAPEGPGWELTEGQRAKLLARYSSAEDDFDMKPNIRLGWARAKGPEYTALVKHNYRTKLLIDMRAFVRDKRWNVLYDEKEMEASRLDLDQNNNPFERVSDADPTNRSILDWARTSLKPPGAPGTVKQPKSDKYWRCVCGTRCKKQTAKCPICGSPKPASKKVVTDIFIDDEPPENTPRPLGSTGPPSPEKRRQTGGQEGAAPFPKCGACGQDLLEPAAAAAAAGAALTCERCGGDTPGAAAAAAAAPGTPGRQRPSAARAGGAGGGEEDAPEEFRPAPSPPASPWWTQRPSGGGGGGGGPADIECPPGERGPPRAGGGEGEGEGEGEPWPSLATLRHLSLEDVMAVPSGGHSSGSGEGRAALLAFYRGAGGAAKGPVGNGDDKENMGPDSSLVGGELVLASPPLSQELPGRRCKEGGVLPSLGSAVKSNKAVGDGNGVPHDLQADSLAMLCDGIDFDDDSFMNPVNTTALDASESASMHHPASAVEKQPPEILQTSVQREDSHACFLAAQTFGITLKDRVHQRLQHSAANKLSSVQSTQATTTAEQMSEGLGDFPTLSHDKNTENQHTSPNHHNKLIDVDSDAPAEEAPMAQSWSLLDGNELIISDDSDSEAGSCAGSEGGSPEYTPPPPPADELAHPKRHTDPPATNEDGLTATIRSMSPKGKSPLPSPPLRANPNAERSLVLDMDPGSSGSEVELTPPLTPAAQEAAGTGIGARSAPPAALAAAGTPPSPTEGGSGGAGAGGGGGGPSSASSSPTGRRGRGRGGGGGGGRAAPGGPRDDLCHVCAETAEDAGEPLVGCAGGAATCPIQVHPGCGGGGAGGAGPWRCEPCDRGELEPKCTLCHYSTGVLKQSKCGKWVHIICALYTPELYLDENMVPGGLSEVDPDRRGLLCGLCRRTGRPACAQCRGSPDCYAAAHPFCVWREKMRRRGAAGGGGKNASKFYMRDREHSNGVEFEIFCDKHMPEEELNHSAADDQGKIAFSQKLSLSLSCSLNKQITKTPLKPAPMRDDDGNSSSEVSCTKSASAVAKTPLGLTQILNGKDSSDSRKKDRARLRKKRKQSPKAGARPSSLASPLRRRRRRRRGDDGPSKRGGRRPALAEIGRAFVDEEAGQSGSDSSSSEHEESGDEYDQSFINDGAPSSQFSQEDTPGMYRGLNNQLSDEMSPLVMRGGRALPFIARCMEYIEQGGDAMDIERACSADGTQSVLRGTFEDSQYSQFSPSQKTTRPAGGQKQFDMQSQQQSLTDAQRLMIERKSLDALKKLEAKQRGSQTNASMPPPRAINQKKEYIIPKNGAKAAGVQGMEDAPEQNLESNNSGMGVMKTSTQQFNLEIDTASSGSDAEITDDDEETQMPEPRQESTSDTLQLSGKKGFFESQKVGPFESFPNKQVQEAQKRTSLLASRHAHQPGGCSKTAETVESCPLPGDLALSTAKKPFLPAASSSVQHATLQQKEATVLPSSAQQPSLRGTEPAPHPAELARTHPPRCSAPPGTAAATTGQPPPEGSSRGGGGGPGRGAAGDRQQGPPSRPPPPLPAAVAPRAPPPALPPTAASAAGGKGVTVADRHSKAARITTLLQSVHGVAVHWAPLPAPVDFDLGRGRAALLLIRSRLLRGNRKELMTSLAQVPAAGFKSTLVFVIEDRQEFDAKKYTIAEQLVQQETQGGWTPVQSIPELAGKLAALL